MRATAKNNKNKIEKHQKIKPGDCIFPFKYKWKMHDSCYETDKGDICATEINLKTRTYTQSLIQLLKEMMVTLLLLFQSKKIKATIKIN